MGFSAVSSFQAFNLFRHFAFLLWGWPGTSQFSAHFGSNSSLPQKAALFRRMCCVVIGRVRRWVQQPKSKEMWWWLEWLHFGHWIFHFSAGNGLLKNRSSLQWLPTLGGQPDSQFKWPAGSRLTLGARNQGMFSTSPSIARTWRCASCSLNVPRFFCSKEARL